MAKAAERKGKLKRDPLYPVDPDREPRPGDDLFFSEVNMNAIRAAIRGFERGEFAEHELCRDYGDGHIPKGVTDGSDPFYGEANLAHLRRGVQALNAGEGVEHDIIEAGL